MKSQRRPGEFRLRFGWHLALWLALGVGVTATAGLVLWLTLGGTALTTTDKLDLVKIALAVTAGVGGVVALVVAFRKQHLSEAEHIRQEDAARRENTKLFNERFSKAADLLSSDKSAARLAGVHAMAGLADDWLDGQQTCVNVLCAYLRMPYTPPKDDSPPAAFEERLVRDTILQTIAAHLKPDSKVSWQGRDLDFTGAVFDRINFRFVEFRRGNISFDDAVFMGDIDFDGVRFDGVRMTFTGATVTDGTISFRHIQTLNGGTIDFTRANLRNGVISFAAANFHIGEVNFVDAALAGGTLVFDDAQIESGLMNFSGAALTGSRITFQNTNFRSGLVKFTGMRFEGGEVDLAHPAATLATEPVFDDWTDGPPPGLLLPPEWEHNRG